VKTLHYTRPNAVEVIGVTSFPERQRGFLPNQMIVREKLAFDWSKG